VNFKHGWLDGDRDSSNTKTRKKEKRKTTSTWGSAGNGAKDSFSRVSMQSKCCIPAHKFAKKNAAFAVAALALDGVRMG